MKKSLDLTRPVQTRGGKKARIIATARVYMYPIVALITDPFDGQESVYSFSLTGTRQYSSPEDSDDLINVLEVREFWTNVYESEDPYRHCYSTGMLYATEDEARSKVSSSKPNGHVATVKLEVKI